VDVTTTSTVAGKVDTSGTVTVSTNLGAFATYFAQECAQILGPSASGAQLAACQSSMTSSFVNFVNTLGSPAPSPAANWQRR